MKKIALLFFFIILSFNGFCDTIDYWHVYINDKLIAEFNLNSKNLTVNINKSELNDNDFITVRYANDHPCSDCIYRLTVLADFKRKAPEVVTKVSFGKLSISIKELLDIQMTDGINTFYFNYYESSINGNKQINKQLFELTITDK
jgi:hypothetical protein